MDDFELVGNFIKAAQLALDAGFPFTAKGILETHWLQGAANEEQREEIKTLYICIHDGVDLERQHGRGAVINVDHDFTKELLERGRIPHERLTAMANFRAASIKSR